MNLEERLEQAKKDRDSIDANITQIEKEIEEQVKKDKQFRPGAVFQLHEGMRVMIVETDDKAFLLYLDGVDYPSLPGKPRSSSYIDAKSMYVRNDWPHDLNTNCEYLGQIHELLSE
jgi:hypothetical protein